MVTPAELKLLADFLVEAHKRGERAVLTSLGRRSRRAG
jgi:hypothetical protein